MAEYRRMNGAGLPLVHYVEDYEDDGATACGKQFDEDVWADMDLNKVTCPRCLHIMS